MRFALATALVVVLCAPAQATDRFPPIPPEKMTPEQKAVADAIMTTRGSMNGPFYAWLRDPALADRLEKTGEQVRFHTSLPHALNEFAILITARHWTSQFEWYAHYPLALKAGLEASVADDLAGGIRPRGMSEDEAVVYDFSTALHQSGTVSDDLYARAVAKFGEQGVIDLVAVNGYYDLVSMTLGVARFGLPDGVAPPLKPLSP
jgi:4-carboxymuconolactone decarboxylase